MLVEVRVLAWVVAVAWMAVADEITERVVAAQLAAADDAARLLLAQNASPAGGLDDDGLGTGGAVECGAHAAPAPTP